jgi:uncharacterized protein YjbI with pentapeptide repeats
MPEDRRNRLTSACNFTRIERETFDGADLSSASLNHLRLDRCSLVAADLRHATLDYCSFRFCDLRRASLRGASLRFASFAGCDLRDTNLRDCDLTGTQFGFVNTGDETGRTNMTGVATGHSTLDRATFEWVIGWPPAPAMAKSRFRDA